MALYIPGKSLCVLCKTVLQENETVVGFPAFLPNGHKYWKYSDGIFHENCFQGWDDNEEFLNLFEKFQSVLESRPKELSYEESGEWGKQACKNLFTTDG